MKNLTAFVFFLLPVLLFSQQRQLLFGKAIADEAVVEFLSIKNLSTDVTVAANEQGSFSINAIQGDVLEFSSPLFKTLNHTLTANDLKEELFVVRLEPSAILLDDVELTGLTGNLMIDSKNTDVILLNEKFKGDFDASVLNLGRVVDNPGGNMNFLAIFGVLANAISPKEPKKQSGASKDNIYAKAKVEHKTFSKLLAESYPESFFTETIKVPREKLGLFLQFCNDGAKRYLLDPKNEAELIVYLKERYARFSNQNQNNEN
jgi:hypothetical protein